MKYCRLWVPYRTISSFNIHSHDAATSIYYRRQDLLYGVLMTTKLPVWWADVYVFIAWYVEPFWVYLTGILVCVLYVTPTPLLIYTLYILPTDTIVKGKHTSQDPWVPSASKAWNHVLHGDYRHVMVTVVVSLVFIVYSQSYIAYITHIMGACVMAIILFCL